MTTFTDTVRGSDALSERDALDALEVLVPVLLAAPDDREAVGAASSTIARMPSDSPVAAVMDWWLVATTGAPSPQGLAHRLPDSIPHTLRQSMEAVTLLSRHALTVPPGQWVQARRDLDRLLPDLDHSLLLDSYGKSKLSGEREVWAFLQAELHPVVTALHDGRRTERFQLDERTYEKEMKRSGIDENSRRWNEMVKRADECVSAVNRVVDVQTVVEPWMARELPPLAGAVPAACDLRAALGPLADLVFTSITESASLDRDAIDERVASRLREVAAGLDAVNLTWLAAVVGRWMEMTGQRVEPLVTACRRRAEVEERRERLESAAVDTTEAALLLLEYDVAGAERVIDRLEERRRHDRREEALRSTLARFRTPEAGERFPEGWSGRVDAAERLLEAGEIDAAGLSVRELDVELRSLRRSEAMAELRRCRRDLERLHASPSVRTELDAYLRDVAEPPDRQIDQSIVHRWRERVESLWAERRRDVERRVQTAHDLLEGERALINPDSLSRLELDLAEVERVLADGDVMAALGLATTLVAAIEGQRVHRWSIAEGESKLVDHVIDYCTQQLHFDVNDVRRLYVAAKTKPFVILAGLTGSGKSTIARLFAAALGADAASGRFRRIAVRPDWIDQSEVLGSVNPLRNRFEPGWLAETARQCERNLDQIHVVLLDEMNLAPVEQYLAEYLSALEESRSGAERTTIPLYSEGAAPDNGDEWPFCLAFPTNLIVIGTVNVDETTRVMSERVLDRANVLQLSVAISDAHHQPRPRSVQPWYVPFQEWDGICVREPDPHNHRFLVEVGEILQSIGIGVGQRAHTELERFVANANEILEPQVSLDLGVLQRVIPKIRGFKRDLDEGLRDLHEKLTSASCTRSAAVLSRWLDGGVADDDYLDGTDARIGLVR
jgi:hypothetical protein